MSSSPILPLELEMAIFELCALSLPIFIPKLMLVAHRVKEWVEPILCRTICICPDDSAPEFPHFTQDTVVPFIAHKTTGFLRKHVRHFAHIDEMPVEENGKCLLAICSDVENLWIGYTNYTWICLVENLPLKRLDVELHLFLRLVEPTRPVFSRLTHLTLDEPAAASALARLPMLSHLALSWRHAKAAEYGQVLELKTLVVFIIFQSSSSTVAAEEEILWLTEDLRFVIMPLRNFICDWHSGIRKGEDYWSDAEAFVAMRQTQGANALSCVWEPADSEPKSDAA